MESVRADPRHMPKAKRDMLVRATYEAMTHIRLNDPALWERIDQRARELREQKEARSAGTDRD